MKSILKLLVSGFFVSTLFANDAVFLPGDLSKTKIGIVDDTIIIIANSNILDTAKSTNTKTMEKVKNTLIELYCSDKEFKNQINSGKDALVIFDYSNGSAVIHIDKCK